MRTAAATVLLTFLHAIIQILSLAVKPIVKFASHGDVWLSAKVPSQTPPGELCTRKPSEPPPSQLFSHDSRVVNIQRGFELQPVSDLSDPPSLCLPPQALQLCIQTNESALPSPHSSLREELLTSVLCALLTPAYSLRLGTNSSILKLGGRSVLAETSPSGAGVGGEEARLGLLRLATSLSMVGEEAGDLRLTFFVGLGGRRIRFGGMEERGTARRWRRVEGRIVGCVVDVIE